MLDKLPGTVLNFSEQAEGNAFSLIEPILTATGGITLSQLTAITGLQGSTIQNWIKRGWVSATEGKEIHRTTSYPNTSYQHSEEFNEA